MANLGSLFGRSQPPKPPSGGSSPPAGKPQTWQDKQLDRRVSVRLAHEAVMLDDAQQLLAQDRVIRQDHYGRFVAESDDMTAADTDDDDGGVKIGDTYNYPPPPPPPNDTLGKLLAGAGLLAAGAGLAWWLAQPAETGPDQNTQYTLQIRPTESD